MLSHDLQNLVADVSAAIAESKSLGRVDLEKLRRSLNAAAREAATAERYAAGVTTAFGELCDGIDRQVADIAGLARHARTQLPAVA